MAPWRAAQASSPATFSAISTRNSPGPISSHPSDAAMPASPSGTTARETFPAGGSAGTGMPCPNASNRARIAAAPGFSSAGRNSAKRPARTPIVFSLARSSGGISSSPGSNPNASVKR